LVSQAVPAVQTLHTPLMQSLLVMQGVPSRAFGPSLQARLSEPHSIRPSKQGQPGFVEHGSSVQVGPSLPAAPSTTPDDTPASTIAPT
jgi:hypothetical protein